MQANLQVPIHTSNHEYTHTRNLICTHIHAHAHIIWIHAYNRIIGCKDGGVRKQSYYVESLLDPLHPLNYCPVGRYENNQTIFQQPLNGFSGMHPKYFGRSKLKVYYLDMHCVGMA